MRTLAKPVIRTALITSGVLLLSTGVVGGIGGGAGSAMRAGPDDDEPDIPEVMLDWAKPVPISDSEGGPAAVPNGAYTLPAELLPSFVRDRPGAGRAGEPQPSCTDRFANPYQ